MLVPCKMIRVHVFNKKFGKNFQNITKQSMQHLLDYCKKVSPEVRTNVE